MSRSRKPSQLRTKSPDITATTVVDRSFPLRDQEVLSLHCAWSFWCYYFVPFTGHAITLRQKFRSFLTRPGDNDEKISNSSSTPKLVQAHDSAVSLTIFLPCLTTRLPISRFLGKYHSETKCLLLLNRNWLSSCIIRGESQVDARNFATVLRDTCQPYVLQMGRNKSKCDFNCQNQTCFPQIHLSILHK